MNRLEKIILVQIVIIALISCSIQLQDNDWKRDNLKGEVESFIELEYNTIEQFGKIEKGGRIKGHSIFYNKQGNQVEYNTYTSDGTLSNTWTNKYDEEGRLIESNSFGDFNLKQTFKYDEKGNLIESSDGYFYKYNEKGNMIEEYYDGFFQRKRTFIYDEKGRKIEMNSKDGLFSKMTYKYDKQENLIEESWYEMDGSLSEKRTYKYDEKRNITEMIIYIPDGNLYIERLSSYTYEYDDKGNWIKKIAFINGTPANLLIREYKYYN